MDIKKINSLIDEVIHIAEKAGEEIMKVYEHPEQFGIEEKDDASPLTIADKKANKVICDGLEALGMEWPIISEENKAIPYEKRKNEEYLWMVDPLDGTKEFIKRNGEFTVNIAVIYKKRTVAGVVHAPVLEETYYAVKTQGAFRIKDGKKEKLEAAVFSKTDSNLGIVCSRSHLNEATENFVNGFDDPEKVSKGSSLKFLIVASGDAHVYPRLAPTMEWDTAAAHVILEEAGGTVLRSSDNRVLEYNKEDLLNPHFIASARVKV